MSESELERSRRINARPNPYLEEIKALKDRIAELEKLPEYVFVCKRCGEDLGIHFEEGKDV